MLLQVTISIIYLFKSSVNHDDPDLGNLRIMTDVGRSVAPPCMQNQSRFSTDAKAAIANSKRAV